MTSAANPLKQYVWDLRYVDSPVVRFHDADTDGTIDDTLYYTTDANMNVTALVDTSGTVLERVVYDPYGNPTFYDGSWTSPSPASSYDNTVLYCGYHLDPETGLYHVRNRMYHATLGRWLQRDPAGYVDGMGLYEYVRSGPVSSLDSSGLSLITSADPDMYQNLQHERLAAEFAKAQEQFLAKLIVMSGQVRSMWDHCCRDDDEFADLIADWEGKVSALTMDERVTTYAAAGPTIGKITDPDVMGAGSTLGGFGLLGGEIGARFSGCRTQAWSMGGKALGVAGATLDACSAVQNMQAGNVDAAGADTAMAVAQIGALAGGPMLAIPVGVIGLVRGGIHQYAKRQVEAADCEICENAKQQYKRYQEGYDRAFRRLEEAYTSLLGQRQAPSL